MHTVLLTDGEFTGMIHALRECGDVRIIGIVFSEYAAHSALLDAYYVAPKWDDPGYCDFLVDIIRKEKVDLVFPVVTKSLEFLASVADTIKEQTGAMVVTSEVELIRIANNKGELLDRLESEESVADHICLHRVVKNISELLDAIRFFEEKGSACIMKPVCGENKDGFLKIVKEDEYQVAFLEGKASRLTTVSILNTLAASLDFSVPMLVMPYLPGQEWDVDILADQGRILSCTIRKNHEMFDGLSACTETSDNPELFRICEIILRILPLSYIFCMSFKEDADGRPMLLEINPRAMGSIYVSNLAGNSLISAFFRYLEEPESHSSAPKITPPGTIASLYFEVMKVRGENTSDSGRSGKISDATSPAIASSDPIEWEPFSADLREKYYHYYNMTDTKITDLTFHCRFAWDVVFAIEYAILEDCLVQISGGGGYTSPFMLMPLGELDAGKLERIITRVRPVFQERNWPFRICTIDEKYKDLFCSLPFPVQRCYFDRDSSDYLYDADSLRSLAGKKYAKKRNHLRHFMETYPEHEFIFMERSLFPECLEVVREWARQKAVDVHDSADSDYLMIKRIFQDWEQLDLRGGAIRIGGKIVGFSIGSIGHPDTAYIHFEKADTEYDGLYVALCKYIATSVFPEVRYINREDDLGIPGLRQSKQSYQPIAMIDKYTLVFS